MVSVYTHGKKLGLWGNFGVRRLKAIIRIKTSVPNVFHVYEGDRREDVKETHTYRFSSAGERKYEYESFGPWFHIVSEKPGDIECEVQEVLEGLV